MAGFGLPSFGFGASDQGSDPIANQQAIARKQKMLEAMQAAQMQQPLVGRQGGVQALAKLVGIMAGRHQASQLEKQGTENTKLYGKALGDEAQAYLDRRMGKPEVPGTTPMADPSFGDAGASGMSGGTPAVPADPRGAIIQAMTSRFPELQRVGMADFTQYGKSQNDETFGHSTVTERDPATGKAISVQYGSKGTRRVVQGAQPYEKPMAVEGNVVDPLAPTKPLASYGVTGGEIYTDKSGDKYQILSNGKHVKLDNAPKISVSATASPTIQGQREGMKVWAEKAGKTVDELAESARNSVKSLGALNNLERADAAGVNSGPTAQIAGFLQGLAQVGGIKIDKAQLANSQTFDSVATQLWANLMQQNGGARGLVKEESERLAQSLPSLIQTPQGRRQIIAVLRQVAHQNIADSKQATSEYAKALRADNPEAFTFGLGNTQLPNQNALPPAPGGPGAAGPIPLDQYLQGQR